MKKIVLVCEDNSHNTFVRQCLKRCQVKHIEHILDPWVAAAKIPGGNVDNVIDRVNKIEFSAWQVKCKSTKVLLIVVADADDLSVVQRSSQFKSSNSSLYCMIIPNRNIETWVKLGISAASQFSQIDDVTDYKKNNTTKADTIETAVKNLFEKLNNPTFTQNSHGNVWNDCKNTLLKLRTCVGALGL